jgi:hypothetical protein
MPVVVLPKKSFVPSKLSAFNPLKVVMLGWDVVVA